MFCKYINCFTRFLLTVNILCFSILEVIKIYGIISVIPAKRAEVRHTPL